MERQRPGPDNLETRTRRRARVPLIHETHSSRPTHPNRRALASLISLLPSPTHSLAMRTTSLLLLSLALSVVAHRSVDPCDHDDEVRTVTVTRRRRTKTVTVTWSAPTSTRSNSPAPSSLSGNYSAPSPVVPLASIDSLSDGSAAAIAGFQNSSYVPVAVGDQIAQGGSQVSFPLRTRADPDLPEALSSAISAQLVGPMVTESVQLMTCGCHPSYGPRRWTDEYPSTQLRTSLSSSRLPSSLPLRPRHPLRSTSRSSTS